MLHRRRQGGFQPPELPGGVLLLNDHHFIAPLEEDLDGLRPWLLMFNLFHLVLFLRSWWHHLGAWWPHNTSDHALRCLWEHGWLF